MTRNTSFVSRVPSLTVVRSTPGKENGYDDDTISSDPVRLLRSMDIAHPVGTLILEALEVWGIPVKLVQYFRR